MTYAEDDFQRVHDDRPGSSRSDQKGVKIDVDLESLAQSDDLDAVLSPYRIADWCCRAIQHGHDPQDPWRWAKTSSGHAPVIDRSQALFAVVHHLHASRLPDGLILSICLNPNHGISAHPLDNGGPRSVLRCLEKAHVDEASVTWDDLKALGPRRRKALERPPKGKP